MHWDFTTTLLVVHRWESRWATDLFLRESTCETATKIVKTPIAGHLILTQNF
jgi:hypothetical protein